MNNFNLLCENIFSKILLIFTLPGTRKIDLSKESCFKIPRTVKLFVLFKVCKIKYLRFQLFLHTRELKIFHPGKYNFGTSIYKIKKWSRQTQQHVELKKTENY